MQIYLDLDGCLADFIGGCCGVFGTTREKLYDRWEPGKFDFHEELGLTAGDFWQTIDRAGAAFWESLPWTQDGRQLLELCEQAGDVSLMTSPPFNPLAAAGKIAWINRELPAYRRRFAITPCKAEYAHAGAILVDDSDKNVQQFAAAGGKVCLVPRRWNSRFPFDHWPLEQSLALVELLPPPGRHPSPLRDAVLGLIEERRQRILADPLDPSWTEHFAELADQVRLLM